jgi:hypothetical protein
MADTINITLDGKSYAVRKLTIRQQIALGIGVSLPEVTDPQENIQRAFDRNLSILLAALSVDHPEVTRDTLLDSRATADERRAAVDTILTFAGLLPVEVKPGEAAGASSTGTSSSPA